MRRMPTEPFSRHAIETRLSEKLTTSGIRRFYFEDYLLKNRTPANVSTTLELARLHE